MRAALIYSSAVLLGLGMWVLFGFDPLGTPNPEHSVECMLVVVLWVAGGGCFVIGTHDLLPPLWRTNSVLDETMQSLKHRL